MKHCRGFSLGLSFCELVPGGYSLGGVGVFCGCSHYASDWAASATQQPSHHLSDFCSRSFSWDAYVQGGIEVSPSTDIFNQSQMITQYSSLDL